MSAIAIDPLQTLKLARVFPAPRERVFRAWTEPAELMRWWGPVGFTTPSAEVDLRVGGKYRIAMRRPDGGVHFVKGTYVDVKPPERLVMTWAWEGMAGFDDFDSLVTIEFVAKGAATEIVLTHEKLPAVAAASHERGWNGTFDHFATHLGQ